MTPNKSIKVVLLGDSSCGKTSLIKAWMLEDNPTKTLATVGASFRRQFVDIDDIQYCIDIWDTAGDEKYSSTIPLYCRSAFGAFIVFDVTRPETFNSVSKWIEILKQSAGDVPYILIGNKADLVDRIIVTQEQANEYASTLKVDYFDTSALTGLNVEDAFSALAMAAVQASKEDVQRSTTQDLVPQDLTKKQNNKSGCC